MEAKKITKFILIALAAWIVIAVLCGMRAEAANHLADNPQSDETVGTLMQLDVPASAYGAADRSSDHIMDFEQGDYIFVIDETGDWYTVYYQGDAIFLAKDDVQAQVLDLSDEVAAELTGISATDNAWINEYLMQVQAQKTAKTWKLIIAGLVVAFIGVTVFNTFRNKKAN